jgi:hypothetical protein
MTQNGIISALISLSISKKALFLEILTILVGLLSRISRYR